MAWKKGWGKGWGAPVAPPSTAGLITNFTAVNAQVWQIDGANVVNQNANQSGGTPWALQMVDSHAVRLEVRQGDFWQGDTGNNRNEVSIGLDLSDCWAAGVQFNMNFTLTINPGPVSTASFFDLCQVHATTDTPPSPFYINLDAGDFLNVLIQSPTVSLQSIYLSPSPIVRGQDYDIRCQVLMGPGGGGYARVWIDDVQVANFSGAIGATGSLYWSKFGLYRGLAPETVSAVFRNVYVFPNGT